MLGVIFILAMSFQSLISSVQDVQRNAFWISAFQIISEQKKRSKKQPSCLNMHPARGASDTEY